MYVKFFFRRFLYEWRLYVLILLTTLALLTTTGQYVGIFQDLWGMYKSEEFELGYVLSVGGVFMVASLILAVIVAFFLHVVTILWSTSRLMIPLYLCLFILIRIVLLIFSITLERWDIWLISIILASLTVFFGTHSSFLKRQFRTQSTLNSRLSPKHIWPYISEICQEFRPELHKSIIEIKPVPDRPDVYDYHLRLPYFRKIWKRVKISAQPDMMTTEQLVPADPIAGELTMRSKIRCLEQENGTALYFETTFENISNFDVFELWLTQRLKRIEHESLDYFEKMSQN